MKPILILIFVMLVSANIFAQQPFNGKSAVLKTEYIYNAKDVPFPSCHASTIVESNEGLIAAWFGGTDEKNPDVGIWVSRFIDGKWSIPVEAANGVQNKDLRYPSWNPVLFKKDNGEIVLYYKVGPDPRSWWGLFKTSKDNGKTWSSKNKIPDNLLGPIKNKPVRLPNGNILYPTSFETPKKWNIYLETSTQDLKNWGKINIDNNNLNSIQPSILFYEDGKMQLLCRSKNKKINQSWSKDKGKTWSAVAPTTLPNNNSGIDAVTLANGMQLLVFNPIIRGRNKLAVAVSKDGVNWNAAILLENDSKKSAEYSYPAVIQTKDGLVHITYTWNRELIKHVLIDPSKIKSKAIVNSKWPAQ